VGGTLGGISHGLMLNAFSLILDLSGLLSLNIFDVLRVIKK
jgi:hypothetical protein